MEHSANTMMTKDTMQYVAISAYLGIEIAQQYDFVVLRNPTDGGIQRVIIAIFHIIRGVYGWCIVTQKGNKAVFSKR